MFHRIGQARGTGKLAGKQRGKMTLAQRRALALDQELNEDALAPEHEGRGQRAFGHGGDRGNGPRRWPVVAADGCRDTAPEQIRCAQHWHHVVRVAITVIEAVGMADQPGLEGGGNRRRGRDRSRPGLRHGMKPGPWQGGAHGVSTPARNGCS